MLQEYHFATSFRSRLFGRDNGAAVGIHEGHIA